MISVLIGFEFSGIVRDAFLEAGFDAWSCDLLATEGDPRNHLQGNVWDAVSGDLSRFPSAIDRATGLPPTPRQWTLGIFHPPCTYLTLAGIRWLHHGGNGSINQHRWSQMEQAAAEFSKLLALPIPRLAVENPRMHRHALARLPYPYDQFIQPYEYGHNESKETALWLKNLPKLRPMGVPLDSDPEQRVHREGQSASRKQNRSRFYPGIAKAMVVQWGPLLNQPVDTRNMLDRFRVN